MTKRPATLMPRARSAAPVRAALVLIVLVLLAGCVERSSPIDVHAFYPINDAEPGRATEFAFHLVSTSSFKQTLPVRFETPEGWRAESETSDVEIRGKDASSLVVRITPDANATYEPHEVRVLVGDTAGRVIVNVRDLGSVPLRSGLGAQLYYVLWWDNGTLASTNDPSLRNRTEVGAAVLDEESPTDVPLKVYVGGERGTPPPEPYNGTGYHAVIPGFDARLRDAGDGSGMVAGETLAVRIQKEDAYTVEGNEDHPLFGVDLNFLIRIVTVDELVARTCDLPVCGPPLGEPS